MTTAITVERLVKHFGRNRALDGLDLGPTPGSWTRGCLRCER
ncbi:hypothetical protein JOE54_000147 [Brachybacterium tyrofermentans]